MWQYGSRVAWVGAGGAPTLGLLSLLHCNSSSYKLLCLSPKPSTTIVSMLLWGSAIRVLFPAKCSVSMAGAGKVLSLCLWVMNISAVLMVGFEGFHCAEFSEFFYPSWAEDHVMYEGQMLKLKLDNTSGITPDILFALYEVFHGLGANNSAYFLV